MECFCPSGRITNLGSSSWNQQDNVTRNTIRLKVLVKATNHSMATVGSNHDVYFGMFVGVDKLTIGKVSLQVSSSASADAITVCSPFNTTNFHLKVFE